MEIQHQEDDSKGRYWIETDGSVATLTYSVAGTSMIIIDHTEVPPALQGTGVGLKLVEAAVDGARAAGKKIMPLCPYAAHQFKKHPEWADVKS